MSTPLLIADNINREFGGLQALSRVSLTVEAGEIKAVIGPNGAGKSTLFNILTGVTPASSGQIIFDGQHIERLPAHQRVERGMARTFQNLQIFPHMTVIENVMVGRHSRTRSGFLAAFLNTGAVRSERANDQRIAMQLLELLGLEDRAADLAGDLSYGEAKIMEIARAMASQPRLLLLDEPMAGLPADAVGTVSQAILNLNAQGVAVLLVEHNVRVVMNLSHNVLVLNNGCAISHGTPEQVRHDQAVIDAYLGEGAHAA